MLYFIRCSLHSGSTSRGRQRYQDLSSSSQGEPFPEDQQLSLQGERGPREVTQQSNQASLPLYTFVYLQLRLFVCIPPCAYFIQIFLYEIQFILTPHLVQTEVSSPHHIDSMLSSSSCLVLISTRSFWTELEIIIKMYLSSSLDSNV